MKYSEKNIVAVKIFAALSAAALAFTACGGSGRILGGGEGEEDLTSRSVSGITAAEGDDTLKIIVLDGGTLVALPLRLYVDNVTHKNLTVTQAASVDGATEVDGFTPRVLGSGAAFPIGAVAVTPTRPGIIAAGNNLTMTLASDALAAQIGSFTAVFSSAGSGRDPGPDVGPYTVPATAAAGDTALTLWSSGGGLVENTPLYIFVDDATHKNITITASSSLDGSTGVDGYTPGPIVSGTELTIGAVEAAPEAEEGGDEISGALVGGGG